MQNIYYPHNFCAALVSVVSSGPGAKNMVTASVSDLEHNRRAFVPKSLFTPSTSTSRSKKKELAFLMEIVAFSK